jgi:hypothetical protein
MPREGLIAESVATFFAFSSSCLTSCVGYQRSRGTVSAPAANKLRIAVTLRGFMVPRERLELE